METKIGEPKTIADKYSRELLDAVKNERIHLAIERAMDSFRNNVDKALAKYPHTLKLAEEVRKIKENSISRWEELVNQAMEQIRLHNGETYLAKTKDEALDIIANIVGTKKLVVKAKSMTSEEIGLREYLAEKGNEIWETDLGEFIIQLLKSRPMHITSPAANVPKEDVAQVFSQVMGKQVPPVISQEVVAAREFMRDKYFKADIGISGANVIAADTGALFILENEGNARLSTGAPPVHIVLAGIEKIIPTTIDAFKLLEVTWRYAGYDVPSYISMIGGPSKTGDIEKTTTYGAHGPKEIHVVFLDNGRSQMAVNPILKESLYCLRCGACMYECPVFAITSGYFGYYYISGIGASWITYTMSPEYGAAVALTCVRCARCVERCPMKIDTPAIIIELRKRFAQG